MDLDDTTATLARVFGSGTRPGNLTALVSVPAPPPGAEALATARRLGVPDTGFLVSEPSPARLVTYSPHEELAFCTQTLLLAGAESGRHESRFVATAGAATVRRDERIAGRWWLEAEVPREEEVADEAVVLETLDLAGASLDGPPAVVGLGRRRLLVALERSEDLAAFGLPPARIRELCAARGWTAVCVAAGIRSGLVALRVFTTSLGGAEDDATGGAALGLLAYRRAFAAGADGGFRVDQGDPAGDGGSTMYVDDGPGGGTGSLGADVDVLVRGRLRPAVPA